ncbi:hypothetical protein OUZ56_012883 [Daphnia magna]|uniref:Uncharacterized protein n=1 Tax=Daphnia magna TaxID=35525 RepID=A0ABQ9Z4F6_9CRUS|nr:hypothetical protein OUZ56_012883 [Daphnia magna]
MISWDSNRTCETTAPPKAYKNVKLIYIVTRVVLEQEQTNKTSDDLNSKQWFNSNKSDNHYQKLEKRLKTSWETRELLLRSPAPGAHPMETHRTQIRGSVLYRHANYSPSGLRICVSFLERTSTDNFFTTIAALSKERMTHLCEEITNLPFHPRQYRKSEGLKIITAPKGNITVASYTPQSSPASPFKRENATTRVLKRLTSNLLGLMGEANLRYARNEKQDAINPCMEVIRQAPNYAEPFQALSMFYKDLGDYEKSYQLSLIAA